MNPTLELSNPEIIPTRDASTSPSLTDREAAVLVGVALGHFLFVHGAIWRHAWSPNASILYSYVPIPFLVAAVLRYGRRLTVTSWFLGTLQVATFKFVISAFMLIAMWAITNPPPDVPAMIRPETATTAQPVTVKANEPAPIDLALGEGSAQPIVLPVGGRLRVHSGDHRMHTLQAPSLGLNVPIVAGTDRVIRFTEPGALDLGCAVHPDEPPVHVTVE